MSPKAEKAALQRHTTNRKNTKTGPTFTSGLEDVDLSFKGRQRKNTRRSIAAGGALGSHVSDASMQNESNNDEDDDNGSENEDNDDEADDGDEVAPSVTHRKTRGHRTGLSVSLSSTKLEGGVVTRKRAWSNRAREEEDIERALKASRRETQEDPFTSDEDDYAGVDLISESEDEEELEKAEEKLIIRSEEGVDGHSKPGLQFYRESSESWDPFGAHAVPAVPAVDDGFFSEHFARTDPYSANELYSPDHKFNREITPDETPVAKRRVRFADDVGVCSVSDSTGTDVDDSVFPDLFANEGGRKSALKKTTVYAPDASESQLADGLYDEQEAELRRVRFLIGQPESDDDGYETDEGETTDEEVLTPVTINRPQALLRLNSESASPQAKRNPPAPMRRAPGNSAVTTKRQGPPLASWVADPTKPFAVVDKTAKNLVWYPVQRLEQPVRRRSVPAPSTAWAGTESSLSPSRPPKETLAVYNSENDRSDGSTQGMLVPSPANLMMSGLLASGKESERAFATPVVGPPKAFYALDTVDRDNYFIGSDADSDDDEEDEYEACIDIHDFIDFGDGSEAETEAQGAAPATTDDESYTAIVHPTAFRQNQLRVQGRTEPSHSIPRPRASAKGPRSRRSDYLAALQMHKSGTSKFKGPPIRAITKRRIETVKN